jgi:fluoride exporter
MTCTHPSFPGLMTPTVICSGTDKGRSFFIYKHARDRVKETAIVFLGGGLGAALRYWLSGSVYRFMGTGFPYGTLLVNVLGCFFIGFLMALFEDRFVVQPSLRLFLTIGVLGGFTTFSTFSYETISLLREGSYLSGTANVVYSILNCLGAAWLGGLLGKLF